MEDPLTRKLEVRGTKYEPLLELSDASVVLGGTRVLDRLTLSIAASEHTAILGPNGAGKSTFIKLLTLQQYPLATDGDASPIRVMGQDRWDVFELRSKLGIVSADLHDRFVHGNSNGVLTGLDAVVSGFFATQGVFRHQRVTDAMRRQATEALDRVDAGRLARATLDTMSTGEARRVLIARVGAPAGGARARRADARTRPRLPACLHGSHPVDRTRRYDDPARHASCGRDHSRDWTRDPAAPRAYRLRWSESGSADNGVPDLCLRRAPDSRTARRVLPCSSTVDSQLTVRLKPDTTTETLSRESFEF